MAVPVRIDFISDISCPWCVIGLRGLEQALDRLAGEVEAEIHFQPFELNPDMVESENLAEHVARKYGATPERSAASRAVIRDRAAAVGFSVNHDADSRIYNTFDAHRLLHWAGTIGEREQRALKHALFTAYFTAQRDPSDRSVLLDAAGEAGLDGQESAAILASDRYADEVRAAENLWLRRGIESVPAIVVDQRYLISGGQPPEAFEQALRSILAEKAAA